MSIRSVTSKDLTTASRSRPLWAAGTLLALLFAVIAYGYQGYWLSPTETVHRLYSLLAMVVGVLLPIVALVVSYMAIAGERESGGIRFLLGFPNTRREVFLGKLSSRLTIFGAGVLFMFGAATSVAGAIHGVVPIPIVLGVFVLSLLYGSVFVGIAVALSAAVAVKSRAIATSVGAYFVLVILFVVPGIGISTIVQWIHTTILGFSPNLNLYNAITYTSPYIAFRKATNLVLPPEQQTQVFRRGAQAGADLPVYLSDEFSLAVFAAWLVIPLVIGYLRFERSDLE